MPPGAGCCAMTMPQSSSQISEPANEPQPRNRLKSLVDSLRAAVAIAKQRPLATGATVTTAVILLSVAAGVAKWYLADPRIVHLAPPTIDAALAALDARQFDEAKQRAEKFRRSRGLRADQLGGAMFVLGAVTVHDAEQIWDPQQRQRAFLLAARYLDDARSRGFPAGRDPDGLYLLAKALHHAGRYAQSLPLLNEALEVNPERGGELHGLLASAYFRDANPRLDDALEHVKQHLADATLKEESRHAALLLQSQILFQKEDVPECRQSLAAIPENSKLHSAAAVMQGRLLMHEAEQMLAAAENTNDGNPPAKEKYSQAIQAFRAAQGHAPMGSEASRQAQFLIGICFRELGDARAAEAQFSRVRRTYYQTPEGFAASVEEADLKRAAGDGPAAVAAYRRLLGDMGDPNLYNNSWVSLEQLRARLDEALADFRRRENYELAAELAKSLWPVFPLDQSVQLEAGVHQSWAEQLMRQSEQLAEPEAQPVRARALSEFRQTGRAYAQLAALRTTTREYPDYLWSSAENLMRGHDFAHAVPMLTKYLESQSRRHRPRALVALGEAYLSLGSFDRALAPLQECIDFHSKHPSTYRARLIASQVYLEQGETGAATKLLEDNLHNESLTPRSLEWRDSLFSLGKVVYREAGRLEANSRKLGVDSDDSDAVQAGLKELESSHAAFQQCTNTFQEIVRRYPDAPQAFEARYLAAQSHWQAAKWPKKRLGVEQIESTRAALRRQMQTELAAALTAYDELLQLLSEQPDQRELTELETTILRNCYFARADVLIDLQRYEEAIAAYSSAANRYHDRPEALEALVQVARCYRELSRPAEARGTAQQAKVVLQQRIAADAQFTKTTRYSREEWTQLLDWLSAL
jgi:tetratricopeptide (TPR) repeat protein